MHFHIFMGDESVLRTGDARVDVVCDERDDGGEVGFCFLSVYGTNYFRTKAKPPRTLSQRAAYVECLRVHSSTPRPWFCSSLTLRPPVNRKTMYMCNNYLVARWLLL
jgi:hypothetical protein